MPGSATRSAATCRTTSSCARSSPRAAARSRRGRRRSSATVASRRDRADRQPALPRHPARMRQVPSPPVRVVGPGAVLRVRRLLRPRRPQGNRALAADLRGRGDRLHRPSRDRSSIRCTGKVLAPKPLFGSAPVLDDPDADPREALARWMTAPDNPYFARVIVNRVWADLMGRGIVDPVDDLRATNPPSNGPLLDALADDFRRPRIRPQAPDPHDHGVLGLRPQLRAERPQRRRHAQLLPPLPAAAAGRGPARRDLRRDRRPRHVRRRSAAARAPRRSGRTASPRSSSTPSAGPTRTRTRPASERATRRSFRHST